MHISDGGELLKKKKWLDCIFTLGTKRVDLTIKTPVVHSNYLQKWRTQPHSHKGSSFPGMTDAPGGVEQLIHFQ